MIFDISMIYHSIYQHKHQISMGNSMGKAPHFFSDPEVCGHKISMHRSDLAMRTMTDFLEELVQFWVWGHADSDHEDPIKSNNVNMAIEESLTIIYIYITYTIIYILHIHTHIYIYIPYMHIYIDRCRDTSIKPWHVGGSSTYICRCVPCRRRRGLHIGPKTWRAWSRPLRHFKQSW
jgi:hypothetical protein